MAATAQHLDDIDAGGPLVVLSQDRVLREDSHWARTWRREHYVRPDLGYEDYAPAYCVGYIGCAQYGGKFEDAERSLCANWERIKGDSRLSLDEALLAMRAAWNRMAGEGQEQPRHVWSVAGLFRRYFAVPSFRFNTRLLR
jgi:hypothetical protein